MKPLTEKQARRCEEACTPRCRCRCGGAGHGVKRNGSAPASRAFFEALPEDDPHYLPPKPVSHKATKKRNSEANKSNGTGIKRHRTIQVRGALTGAVVAQYDVIETIPADLRMCACGCGGRIPDNRRADCLYISDAHRKRALRNAEREQHFCACGCGKTFEGERKRFYSNACRQRYYRAVNAEEKLWL